MIANSRILNHTQDPFSFLFGSKPYWLNERVWWQLVSSFILLVSPNLASVQFSHSVVSDSATPWIAARQASLSITNSQSLLKIMSIELVMPSNHLILCHPLLLLPSIFPSIRCFLMSQLFETGGQSIGASASASVLSMTILDWFPLGFTGLISLQSKRLSRVFSNTTL